MKFLLWLFNFAKRHRGDIRRYEKGTKASRIVAIVMMTIFSAATIVMEFFTFKVFEGSFGWGLFCALFTIAMTAATSETAGIYAYCGFKYYARGTVGEIASRYARNKGDEVLGDMIDIATDDKSHKKIDLAVGIIGLIIAIGIVVSVVTILVLRIKGALMAL